MNNVNESGRGVRFMRKAAAIGALVSLPSVGVYCGIQEGCHNQVLAAVDKDFARVEKERERVEDMEKFVNNLEKTQKMLGDLEEKLSANGERVGYPIDLVQQLDSTHQIVTEMNGQVSKMVGKGLKLNSGVVVDDVAQINALQAVLNAKKLADYVNRSIRSREIERKFVNMEEIQAQGVKLSVELDNLKRSLDDLSDPSIEMYSNHDLFNKNHNTTIDNPRLHLQHDFHLIDYALQAGYNNDMYLAGDTSRKMMPQGCDVADGGHMFVVKYGFLEMPNNWDMSAPNALERRGELNVKAYEEVKKFMVRVMKIASAFNENGRPVKGPEVQKLQSMLINGGYLDYSHTSGEYDEELHRAYRQFWDDMDFNNGYKLEYLEINK